MHRIIYFFVVLGLIWFSAPAASAAPASPLLVPADLDRAVEALPVRAEVDPITELEDRLAHLRQEQVTAPERPALSQALDIIRLTRTIRLTTSQRPIVAGL